jgi:hypothetical protein
MLYAAVESLCKEIVASGKDSSGAILLHRNKLI